MNRYIITCINDFETYSGYAAYAESLFDEDMTNAADAYAFEIAVGIVPDSFIVTTEGYEYHNMTEEAIRQVVDSIEWEDYYNYKITPYEGTDEEFDKLILIYDGRLRQRNSDSRVDEGEIEPVQG